MSILKSILPAVALSTLSVFFPFTITTTFVRNSHQSVQWKSSLEYLAKFTRKQLCQSLFFNKVSRPATSLKRLAQMFCCKFCEIFKNTFFHRIPLFNWFCFVLGALSKWILLCDWIVIGNSSSNRFGFAV